MRSSQSQRALSDHGPHKKTVVLGCYDLLYRRWNFDAARQHIDDHFVQYDPAIAESLEGAREWVDGDSVGLHTVVSAPAISDMPEIVIAEMPSLGAGKFVEYRDGIQRVIDEARHDSCVHLKIGCAV